MFDMWDVDHVMIDLETLSTSPNAAISSIGVVKFQLDGNVEPLMHIGVDLQSCLDLGLEVDGSTIEWWLGQSKENQDRLLNLNKVDIEFMVQRLNESLTPMNRYLTKVWSHGSVFDIMILENVYRKLGKPTWWNFRNICDTRTLFSVAGHKYKSKGGHDALEDAMSQAKAVIESCNKLKGGVSCEP